MQSAVSSELRPTGIEGLHDLPWGAHFCHFFRDAEDLGETLVPFFRAGLAANERCVWLVDEALPAAMARRLLRLLPGGRELEEHGRLEVIEWRGGRDGRQASVSALAVECIEREKSALAAGHSGVRVAGSALATAAIHRGDGRAQFATALAGHKVLALCGQWLQSSSADDLLEVLERQGNALVRDRARGAVLVRAELPGVARTEPVSSSTRAAPRESDEQGAPSERRQDSLAEVALQHLARLQRVTSALSEAVSLSDVCEVLRSEMVDAVAARHAWVALASEDEGVLESIAGTGEGPLRGGAGRDSVSRESVGQEAPVDEPAGTVLQEMAAPEIVIHDAVIHDAVIHDTMLCNTVSRDTVSRDTVSRDTVSRDTVSRDTVSRDTVSRDTVSRETTLRDAREGMPSDVRELLSEHAPSASAVRALLDEAYHQRRPRWPSWPSRLVALPLSLGPRTLGAVAFELRQASELEPGERALFADLVRPLSLALDRARLYELARQERDRAEEANQAKDEFLAVLGHELRNPLAPILTALELMRARAGDVALRERGVIERQLNHMVRLVDDLLDVARITRGSLRLSRSQVELAEVVDRAIEMASPMLDARSHRLSVAVPRRGLTVDIDFHRVAQALGNLLMNSAKYTSHGGTIELGAHLVGERVLLEVRDDGIGIDADLLRRIFEPFVQRKQALDRSHGGLGLGLTIARRLIELHGGTMNATSAGPGQGSTFTIELNLAMPTDPKLSADVSSVAHAPVASSDDAIRVLVVDDNVDAAEMLAEALRMQGHHVGVAHDGPAALALVEDFQPDLALLDIGLPVMDGFDLAQRLKRRLSAHPPKFIAVTGYGQPSDRVRSQQAGFDEHLVKPIDLARLSAIVNSVERLSV